MYMFAEKPRPGGPCILTDDFYYNERKFLDSPASASTDEPVTHALDPCSLPLEK